MAFTVEDFHDLVRLLEEHPEWRAQLRPLILGEEILEIPSRMDRVEAALAQITIRLDALTAAQQENARQIAILIERMDKIDGRMGNIEGGFLEMRYQRFLPLWFADWLRKPREAGDEEFDQLQVAREAGAITMQTLRQYETSTSLSAATIGRSPATHSRYWPWRSLRRSTSMMSTGLAIEPKFCVAQGSALGVSSGATGLQTKRAAWPKSVGSS